MKERLPNILYIFFLSILFLLLTCLHIEKPFPDWEETNPVYPAIAMITGNPIPLQCNTIQIYNRQLPIMQTNWAGSLEAYLILPMFKIFGVSIHTLRITEILFGILFGLLFGYLCYLMFGKRIYYVATPLILFNPTYLFYSRRGFEAVMLVLWGSCALCLVCFWKWVKSQKMIWLYLSAFIMGLGMYGKLHFLWIVCGIAVGWAYVVRPQYKLSLKSLDILKIFLAWLSGFLPYIIQNICTRGSEIRSLFHMFLYPADGSTNLDYFKHLYTRFMQLGDALGGISFCEENILWAGGIKKAIVIAFLVIIILALAQEKLKEKKTPLLFLLICIFSFMFGVALNGSSLGYNHVFPIVPLVIICGAVGLTTLIRKKVFLFLSVFLILTPDFFIIINYQKNLQRLWDNPIIGFSNYLLSQGFFSPIFISQFRVANLVAITTHGKVFPIEAHPSYLMERCNEWLEDRKNVYILAREFFPPAEEEEKKAYAIFNEILQRKERRIYILKEYPIDSTSVFICKVE